MVKYCPISFDTKLYDFLFWYLILENKKVFATDSSPKLPADVSMYPTEECIPQCMLSFIPPCRVGAAVSMCKRKMVHVQYPYISGWDTRTLTLCEIIKR